MIEGNKSCPGLAVESRQDENVQPTMTTVTVTPCATPSTPAGYYRPFAMSPITPTPHTPSHYHPR
jgi:hypothetical protein